MNWTISEQGLLYIMEYSNGFKRAIRKSQVALNIVGASGFYEYSSSQSPYIVMASVKKYISSYTAGTSTIDFVPDGLGGFNVSFKIIPDNTYKLPLDSITDYVSNIVFWQAKTQNIVLSNVTETTNTTINTGILGEGVYDISQQYNFSDNSLFRLSLYVKVDSLGNIVAISENKGIIINSVSGLNIDIDSNIVQTGNTDPIKVSAISSSFVETTLSTGVSYSGSIPSDTSGMSIWVDLDETFWSDIDFGVIVKWLSGSILLTTIS